MNGTPSFEDILTVPDDIDGMLDRFYTLFPDGLRPYPRELIEDIEPPHEDDDDCDGECEMLAYGSDTARWPDPRPRDDLDGNSACEGCFRRIPWDHIISGAARLIGDYRICVVCTAKGMIP